VSTTAQRAFELLCESRTAVVVDVETCPSPDGNRIISIAAVTCRNGRTRGTWSTLLDPGVPITNSKYHGLTDADVAGKRTFADIVGELDGLLDEPGTILVAHNASFDVGCLHLEHHRLSTGEALRDVAVLDTMRLPDVLEYQMPSRSRTLAALCSTFDVTNVRPHDAASDATATADVLHALLRVAARQSCVDLGVLHTKAGGLTAQGIGLPADKAQNAPVNQPSVPAEHIATHSSLLEADASPADLDAWAAGATECANLCCYLLNDKAAVALEHAGALHARLTTALVREGPSLGPGQGATLMGAVNILAPRALRTAKVTPLKWWQKHRAVVQALERCDLEVGACPDCLDGHPCPIDIAHQPLVVAAVVDPDGSINRDRRSRISKPNRILETWVGAGAKDMAGYAAWLMCDTWLAEQNQVRSDPIVDRALGLGATDPRLVQLYAQRLAAQQRHADIGALMAKHTPDRTTDPGWQELADWHLRYTAQQTKRRAPVRPTGSPRVTRPAGRVRPNRFTP
jgi:DNA polymerase III epsilon subunit family exonuclease